MTGGSDSTSRGRRRYRVVLIASMVLLGIFLTLVARDAYRAEYARQVRFQTSRIAGIGAKVGEIADVARARVMALGRTTALTYETLGLEHGVEVPMPQPGAYTQVMSTPHAAAQQAYEGTILAHPLSLLPPGPEVEQAWRQDYQVFRALWLTQAGLHAASRNVALSYVVSAATGASANYPALPQSALARVTRPRPPRNPQFTPFLRMLDPEALPGRGLVWLPIYYDPASASTRIDASVKGDGRVISLIAPVDVEGRFRAGVGVDIWAEEMRRILRDGGMTGTALTLADGAGLVIATTRAAPLKAAALGQPGQATDAAALLQIDRATLGARGLVKADRRLLFITPIANTPFRLVGQLDPGQLRNAALAGLGPLIAGAVLLYLLLCLAIWYVMQRVFEPAFALAEHIQSLGRSPPPRLSGLWARVLDVTESGFAERRRFEAELAKQREALHQSEKMSAFGSLLAGVAHELNNPLAVVVGRSAILAEALEGSPHERGVTKLRDAADRCSRIVKTFLAMARQSGPRRTTVDINELVESALDMTGYGLRTAGVTIVCDFDAQLPRTSADGDQIIQILINLIVNAQHALAAAGGQTDRRLTISTRLNTDDETIRITITDNGPGVPSDIAGRVFDPFFTTKQVGQGTGMGLAVSRGMAEAQGGTLHFLPAAGGAVFLLSLPVALVEESAGISNAAPIAQLPSNLRALVVDDEAEVGELIRDSLEGLFMAIDLCRDGPAALAAVAARQYHLVICDLRMPEMSGIELYQRLVQSDPRLSRAFVFVSGDFLYREELRSSPAAGLPVLEKPFGPDELRDFVLKALQQQSQRPKQLKQPQS